MSSSPVSLTPGMAALLLLPSCSADTDAPHPTTMDSVAHLNYEIDTILDRHPDLTSAERSFMTNYLAINQQFLDNDDVVDRLRADTACRCLLELSSGLPLLRSNPPPGKVRRRMQRIG